jgi:hypothetical protein
MTDQFDKKSHPGWGVVMVLTIALVGALTIWGNSERQAKFDLDQRNKIQTESENRQWSLDHPKEAAEQQAKYERMMANIDRDLRSQADCTAKQPFEAAESCLAETKRAALQECLQGPDWKECPGMRPQP